ncbi:MAG TPA: hypothetical protein VML96_05730 [Egibacteraceae bacterium]|nr:hypothetical protein [Egibacteraceae bacterium]
MRGTRCRRFSRITCQLIGGIRVPDPGFTLCGVAGLADLPHLRGLVIDTRQRRLATLSEVSACCDALSPLKGLPRLRRAVWQLDESRCDSVLEWELRRKLRAAGFRPDARPAGVDTGARTLHVDIPWSKHRVGVEVDGFASHSSRASLNTDIRRHNRMQRTDWRILHASWAQLDSEFEQLAADLTWLLLQRS